MNPCQPLRVFCSYSHEDKQLRNQLEKHVALLKRQGFIEFWHDGEIVPGNEWRDEIRESLESSHIILLLVSSSFIASDFCYAVEMMRALERHRSAEAHVVPIILRPVDWKTAPFGRLQALPTDGKPITTWSNRDEGWLNVVEGLRQVIAHLSSRVNRGSANGSTEAPTGTGIAPKFAGAKPWLDQIDGDALPKFIESNAPLIRVISGPGSGKTTGIKRRVQRLIQKDGMPPNRIYVGTFARVIARELKEELGIGAGGDELPIIENELQVSTLHSLAFRLLRKYPLACPGRRFRFLLKFEEQLLLYDLGEEFPDLRTQREREKKLRMIFAQWADGQDLHDDRFVGALDRWLRWHGGMLIEEVVKLAQRALEMGDIEQGIFDHVIIDEYQDLTRVEQRLVELLWSKKGSLAVLGDDNQSIYSFRFNHPSGVAEFADRFGGASIEDIQLLDNRRSQPPILALGNQLMAQAGSTMPPMHPVRTPDNKAHVSLVHWPTLEAEISGLAQYIQARSEDKFLVLVPRRFIGYRLQEKLGVAATTSFHQEALASPLVRERLTAATLLATPDDRIALRAWFGFRSDEAVEANKRNAPAYASLKDANYEVRELVDAIISGRLIPTGQGQSHIKARAQKLRELWDSGIQGIEALMLLFDPRSADATSDEDERRQTENDLISLRDAGLEIAGELDTEDLSTILEHLRYRIAARIPLFGESKARVRIMTLHGAKGLEADNVIVAGLADQVVPGKSPDNPTESEMHREEQRRLLYVAVTRARDTLVVSWPRRIKTRDARNNQIRIDNDSIRTIDGERCLMLSTCSLIPRASAPQDGQQWLRATIGRPTAQNASA